MLNSSGVSASTASTFRWAAIALAAGIFVFDVAAPFEGAIAALYALVVFLVSLYGRRQEIVTAAFTSVALTVAAYIATHGSAIEWGASLRVIVSLAAIAIATTLVLQNHAATQRLRSQAALINLSHDMIFVREVSGPITFWNEASRATYGWSQAEAIGKDADTLLGTIYPESREAVEQVLFEKGHWEGILRQTTRSGTEMILESRWALRRNGRGEVTGVMETHRDVTSREHAHAVAARTERRFSRVYEASRLGVVQEDWSGVRQAMRHFGEIPAEMPPDFVSFARDAVRIIGVNPAVLTMLGISSETEDLSTVDDILVDTDRTFAGALSAFARGDSSFEGETEIRALDGRRVPVLFTISFPAAEDDGDTVLVCLLDMSDAKRSQIALQQAQADLAHASRNAALGEFTAVLAHEVNQPLMAIVTNGEAGLRWLQRSNPELGEVEAAIGRMVEEGRRAGQIVKRIRDFIGTSPPERRSLTVRSLVGDACVLAQHELIRSDIRVDNWIEDGLPQISGDRILLQQALVNLIVGSGQSMEGKPGPKHVKLAVCQHGDGVEVCVTDNGPRIPEEQLERILEPFSVMNNGAARLDLAICRSTVEAHGGSMTVQSSPNGSTFCIFLPGVSGDAA